MKKLLNTMIIIGVIMVALMIINLFTTNEYELESEDIQQDLYVSEIEKTNEELVNTVNDLYEIMDEYGLSEEELEQMVDYCILHNTNF